MCEHCVTIMMIITAYQVTQLMAYPFNITVNMQDYWKRHSSTLETSGVPRNFFRVGVQQIQLSTEDRENGDLVDGSPLVRGSGGSCNLVQEISFHIVKFFFIFGTLRLFMMTTNLFVIANVKQL